MVTQAHPYYAHGALYPQKTVAAGQRRDLSRLLLAGVGLMLTSAPLARVYAGSLPINFIDLLVAGLIGLVWAGIIRPISLKRSSPIPLLVLPLVALGRMVRRKSRAAQDRLAGRGSSESPQSRLTSAGCNHSGMKNMRLNLVTLSLPMPGTL